MLPEVDEIDDDADGTTDNAVEKLDQKSKYTSI